MAWLRFFRWINLVIIALTMLLLRHAAIGPFLGSPTLYGVGQLAFLGMVLSTVLIAVAGNVANDIADQEIDEINKPDRVFVGRRISTDGAMNLTAVALVVSALALIPLIREIGFSLWLLLFPGAAALLLAYAFGLKCTPVVGNLVVSILPALVPLLVYFSDYPAVEQSELPRVLLLFSAYALFAFLTSLFREITKDLQDAQGDEIFGCRTLAVRAPEAARRICIGSAVLLLVLVPYFLWRWNADILAWAEAGGLILLPLALAAVLLTRARTAAQLGRVSLLAKFAMVGGLLLVPLLTGVVRL